MSARTPFVPNRSAPSRPSTTNPEQNPAEESFRANGLLQTSHDTHNLDTKTSTEQKTSQSEHDKGSSNVKPGINKPLNITSFAKKHSNNATAFSQSRRSVDGNFAPTRSRSPRLPPPNQQSLRASGPRSSSPFFPVSSGLVSMNDYRPLSSLSHTNLHTIANVGNSTDDSLRSNGAHISTSTTAAGLHATGSDSVSLVAQIFSLSGTRIRSSTRPSLEKIQETAEEHEAFGQYTRENDFSDEFRNASHLPAETQFDEDETDGRRLIQHPLRRTTKRGPHVDSEDEPDYGNVAKRYKPETNDFVAPYSRDPTPTAHYTAPALDDEVTLMLPHHRNAAPPPYARISGYNQHTTQETQEPENVLQRIFGLDLDTYVEAHVGAYEEAKKKWAGCSMEEWTAGADELAGKFAKMVDYVKDRMTSKLTLYASLHATIATHRTVLSEREEGLKSARENLIREGGNVVGSGATGLCGNDTGKQEKKE